MQKQKLPSVISLLILTMITAVMWIGFTVYRALTSTPTPTVPVEISSPLTPALDKDTINKIESAIFYGESEVPQLNFVSTPAPSAIPTPLATPVPSATPEASPSASPTP